MVIAMTHLELAHDAGDSRLVGYLVRAIRPMLNDTPQVQEQTQLFGPAAKVIPPAAEVIPLAEYMTC